MGEVNKLLEQIEGIGKLGVLGILAVIVILVVHEPDRAEKLKALVIKPFYRFLRWGRRAYIGSEVSYNVTTFVSHHIRRAVPSIPDIKVKVRWVSSPDDPVWAQEGTLVLRMRDSDDQTRNILAATRAALPSIVCSGVRTIVDKSTVAAVDMAILNKLAACLGKPGIATFRRYFLHPEIGDEPATKELFSSLVELDSSGVFVAIFLRELEELGDRACAIGCTEDKTPAVAAFLEFLLGVVRRQEGEKVPLDHVNKDFAVGIVLLAVTRKAFTEGVVPYINRVERILREGCDSIYVVAFRSSRDFLSRVLEALDGDPRVLVGEPVKLSRRHGGENGSGFSELALLKRNEILGDHSFSAQLDEAGIAVGKVVEGEIVDVSNDVALVSVSGLNAKIERRECSWTLAGSCQDLLKIGQKRTFIVSNVDVDLGRVSLSLRFESDDPWRRDDLPDVGQEVSVRFEKWGASLLTGITETGFFVEIPYAEVSWLPDAGAAARSGDFVGGEQTVMITGRNDANRALIGSIRQVNPDPWDEIAESLPKGSRHRGTVVMVDEAGVVAELSNGIRGIVPASSLIAAGHEFEDFEHTVVPGQGLDVIVSKVFRVKRKVRLDLARNIPPDR